MLTRHCFSNTTKVNYRVLVSSRCSCWFVAFVWKHFRLWSSVDIFLQTTTPNASKICRRSNWNLAVNLDLTRWKLLPSIAHFSQRKQLMEKNVWQSTSPIRTERFRDQEDYSVGWNYVWGVALWILATFPSSEEGEPAEASAEIKPLTVLVDGLPRTHHN